ncbi:metalloprotease PmbA [Lysobacteraceae bacterium NML08-0793]|nr:metalloprotease PmbA [Xanthomonadaceae bacterium NML08-0793]
MTHAFPVNDDSIVRLDRLEDTARQLLALARQQGASQAEVSCSDSGGLAISVRMGEVETVESTRDRGIGITVYFGKRKGTASTGDVRAESLAATVAQACAIARHTEEDPAAGLADAELMAKDLREFDTWHPAKVDAEAAIDLAMRAEAAGRAQDLRIGNSDGASFASNQSLSVYANSHGFVGRERGSHYSLGCALIAGTGDAMQRDGWYSMALALDGLEDAEAIGRRAAERTLARLAPRTPATGEMPVIFSAEVASSLIGHYLSAVSGGALYRRASFLCDSLGQALFPDWFWLEEDPFLMRGFRSGAYDAEGVATQRSHLVKEGRIQRYVLGSYSARKLGLASTANAGGIHNVNVSANAENLAEIVRGKSRALYVTELMGQGVNMITGDYSRGAAGFMVENGEIAYPVDGLTIAGNLRQMFGSIEAVGADFDTRSYLRIGPVLVGKMTVAGG